MCPLKCLEGPERHWCHVPHPCEIRRDLSQDLVDLEYDHLFLWKAAPEYGIDPWNGVYYRLCQTPTGYRGVLNEVDLGQLGIPPEAGNLRPVSARDLHEAEAERHGLPWMVIE